MPTPAAHRPLIKLLRHRVRNVCLFPPRLPSIPVFAFLIRSSLARVCLVQTGILAPGQPPAWPSSHLRDGLCRSEGAFWSCVSSWTCYYWFWRPLGAAYQSQVYTVGGGAYAMPTPTNINNRGRHVWGFSAYS